MDVLTVKIEIYLKKNFFFVENNCDLCDLKKTSQNNNDLDTQKNIINNPNNNIIKLREDEVNINNKININNVVDKIENNKKNINNPQFIVNKNVNNNINNINNISPTKIKNRTRFFSFDDDMSSISQWNNLNLKKIEISDSKLIIDNYNINHPDDIANSISVFQPNNFLNTNNVFNNNSLNNNNSHNMIITRKNSAFSAIIK